jgi:hypothetical protein
MSLLRLNRYLLALSLVIASFGLQAGTISHIVMVWLKPEVTEAQAREIMEATKMLGQIPGVSGLRVGKAMPSERAVVDDSFSFGITMDFTGPEMMDDYLKHPVHVEYLDKYIKGKAARILIYDF